MKQPDTLIQAMQNGDEKALGQIYTMYSEAVYGISYSIVGKETIAQELVQDVFIKIWNNCGAY
ncbi:MAG: RNA polymerase sigma factor, partial [Marinirhabdus sp.]